jgi:hypothetical protein
MSFWLKCLVLVVICSISGFEISDYLFAVKPTADLHVLPGLPAIAIKTPFLIMHVFGVVLGLGSAVFMDGWMLRHSYSRPIAAHTIELMKFAEWLVSIGLVLLWISGLGFVFLYWQESNFCISCLDAHSKLLNPKMWSKMSVVVLLTLNGLVIHRLVPAYLEQSIGKPLFKDADPKTRLVLMGLAAVSVSGWLFAFTLGMVKELNFAAPFFTFILAYGVILTVAFGSIWMIDRLLVSFNEDDSQQLLDDLWVSYNLSQRVGRLFPTV